MEQTKCPNCSASMILVSNSDGTKSYKCQYCGGKFPIPAKTVSDKVFAFVNRVANAFSDNPDTDQPRDDFPGILDPAKKAEMQARFDELNRRRQQAVERYQEKRLKAYEKYVDRLNKKR